MGRIRQLFGKVLPRRQGKDDLGAEELRTVFKARYHQFKLLLNANNKALEVMSEMEEAIKGTSPFGMKFVRSRCTSISANVFKIIKHLDELGPRKYERLFERFKEIQKQINPYLRIDPGYAESPAYTFPLNDINRDLADLVGAKMANLGEIRNVLRLPVPNGFVITAGAYRRFMEHNDLQPEIDRLVQAAEMERPDQLYRLSTAIQQLIIRATIPDDLETAVSEQYRALEAEEGKAVKVILRSSALGEDLAGASLAGQYRSELNVSRENLFQAYKEIVASKYGIAAMTYRFNRGIPDEEIAMCVGCLAMVDALSGGVVYTRNPVDIRDDAVSIHSVWGLPKPVVDGSATADLFVVARGDPMTISRREIAAKFQKFVCYPEEGVCRLDLLTEEGERPSLTDERVLELAELSMRLEKHYGTPRDIEWAISNEGSVLILQCRLLEQMKRPAREPYSDSGKEPGAAILRGGARASPGAGAGPVFFVKKDVDALRFPTGAVLIAEQSLPRWATVLNRASAVVTEQGSISGHLANVAREFGVPALFGVHGALTLQPGQVITVDADGLRIYEGLIEEVLQKRDEPRNLMQGSPVYEALSGAARFITPLNLLDPDAPTFRPESCRTLHDITRFCHEKAVDEMFRFGKEHHFPERSSKQLLGDAPMQWWVLNLDDGFKEEVEGRYIRLENIDSIPMLALWEGITAVPWEGPPPVDGKGLMSVMFEATQNRTLVPGMRSQYANRNYFMISKNYCSLSSRLGFHFSIIETLVSERASENYISFQYKGGAADSFRKIRRVLFIQEILEEHGFRAEVREDALIARVEGGERTVMERNLRILGYLTMHTRQLDMIMSNEAALEYYRTKIKRDIRETVCAKD